MKNLILSIQGKLRQLAQIDGKNFQLILINTEGYSNVRVSVDVGSY